MSHLLHLFILVVLVESITSYRRIEDYNQYTQEWKKIVPLENIHNVSGFALNKQLCYDRPCQFYYYQFKDETIKEDIEQRTVLFVSGMHGNEFLGPHTLLYAYKHLKAYRILYFPMANPSGFNRHQRTTYPSGVDPNRDYPIDRNFNCYEATATFILDAIYRQNQIDLTIIIHNGGTQIGFNWGTQYLSTNSHTVQYPINIKIAEMMKKVGGKSKKLSQFIIGTMVQTIYPANGTFDDWSYAASRYPEFITKCSKYQYKPYPQNMTNGLVFLIQMGPFSDQQFGTELGIQLSPLSQSKHNGHISRVIRILRELLHIFSPRLAFKWSQHNQNIQAYIKGCNNGKISNLTIHKHNNFQFLWEDIINKTDNATSLQGNLRYSEPKLTIINFNKEFTLKVGDRIKYKGTLQCDPQWNGLGSTFFSSPRIYHIQEQTQITIQKQLLQVEGQEMSFFDFISKSPWDVDYVLIIRWIIAVLLACILSYLTIVYALLKWKEYSQKRKSEKFEASVNIESQSNFEQEQTGGDLHTARGGIIQM